VDTALLGEVSRCATRITREYAYPAALDELYALGIVKLGSLVLRIADLLLTVPVTTVTAGDLRILFVEATSLACALEAAKVEEMHARDLRGLCARLAAMGRSVEADAAEDLARVRAALDRRTG